MQVGEHIQPMNDDDLFLLTEVDVEGSPFDADNYWRYCFRLWFWHCDDQVEMYAQMERARPSLIPPTSVALACAKDHSTSHALGC